MNGGPASYVTSLSPELCLIVGGCVVLLLGTSRKPAFRALTAPLAIVSLLAAMGMLALFVRPLEGAQPPGLLFTHFAVYVRWITLLVGALIFLVNRQVPIASESGEYFGMALFCAAGVMLTASANDLIVLFFAIELVSVPTYVMVALSRVDSRASEGAVKYFFLGALATAVLAYGFSFLYGAAGTTVLETARSVSLSDMLVNDGAMTSLATLGLVLSLAALCFKIAAVPFHGYVPDVYEGAASPLTGLLGFLPKLAGFVAIIKLINLCHWDLPETVWWLLWVIAVATMTVGNALALLQTNVKRILAYSSISHSGYMLIGVLAGPVMGAGPLHNGLTAVLFYIVVYGIMNLGAFAVLASFANRGEPIETLDDLAGLSKKAPAAALAMAVCVFGLMGFPPTAGFLGKVYIFSSALSVGDAHAYRGPLVVLVVIAVINSAVGAAYYLRIAAACYLREPKVAVEPRSGLAMNWALSACTVLTLILFIHPALLARPARWATLRLGQPGGSFARVEDRPPVDLASLRAPFDSAHVSD